MPIRTIEELKSRFQNADQPDGADFVDLIDTLLEIGDNSVTAAKVPNGELPVTKLDPAAAFQMIRTRSDASAVEWFSPTSNQILVTQTTHGFAAGDVLTINPSGQYVLAKADTFNTRQPVGIVLSSESANLFILATGGLVTNLPFSVTPGVWHYLSAASAGVLTTTAPSGGGEYVAAVLYGYSANSGLLFVQEAKSVVTGTGTYDPVYIVPRVLLNHSGNGTIYTSFHTFNLDTTPDAGLAGTPFRFAIIEVVGYATNDNVPTMRVRKDIASPEYTVMRLRANNDTDDAPDSGAHIFFMPVVTSPKSFDMITTSVFNTLTVKLIGYIP